MHPVHVSRYEKRIRIHLQPSAPPSSETGLKSPGSRREEVFQLQGSRAPAPGKPRSSPREGVFQPPGSGTTLARSAAAAAAGGEAPCRRKSSLPLNLPVKINK